MEPWSKENGLFLREVNKWASREKYCFMVHLLGSTILCPVVVGSVEGSEMEVVLLSSVRSKMVNT